MKKMNVEQAFGVFTCAACLVLYALDCAGQKAHRERANARADEMHKSIMEGHRIQMQIVRLELEHAKKEMDS